jgi:hypothetical protein
MERESLPMTCLNDGRAAATDNKIDARGDALMTLHLCKHPPSKPTPMGTRKMAGGNGMVPREMLYWMAYGKGKPTYDLPE